MEALSREEQLDALREKVAGEGRVIVDMLCDGESLSEEELLSAPDGIDVDVHTNTPCGLGVEILDEVKDSLLKVFRCIQEALDGTQMFDPLQLREAFEQLGWVGDVFEGFADAYPEYGSDWPRVEPLVDELNAFQSMLSDGRYADAQAWHEHEWKLHALPPFLDRVKDVREWFIRNDRPEGESEDK